MIQTNNEYHMKEDYNLKTVWVARIENEATDEEGLVLFKKVLRRKRLRLEVSWRERRRFPE